jgi:hypothetical protein
MYDMCVYMTCLCIARELPSTCVWFGYMCSSSRYIEMVTLSLCLSLICILYKALYTYTVYSV